MDEVPPPCDDGSESDASEEEQHNAWNNLLEPFTSRGSILNIQQCQKRELCRTALTCHFVQDVIDMSMEW